MEGNDLVPEEGNERVEEDGMTFDEKKKVAYLLRYENMVKHQECEDMAVREHLVPIFEKLSSGKSILTFDDMYHWVQVLETCTPEQECIVTDAQLMMILDTFQRIPTSTTSTKTEEEEGWTLMDFTFCYKFIILGMQTLEHLSMQDEEIRQQFKDIFFQMLQHYKQQQQQDDSTSTTTSNTNLEENPEETMRKLLTLKDGQMEKLISNLMEEEEEEEEESFSVAPMSFTSRDSILEDDEEEQQDNKELEPSAVHIRPRRKRQRRKQQKQQTQSNLFVKKGIYLFNLCLIVMIFMGIVLYVIDILPTTTHPYLDAILSSSSTKTQPPPVPTSSMQLMPPPPKQQQNVWTNHDWTILRNDLTRSMEQSQNELMEARLQIQSLVSVLADYQQKPQQQPQQPTNEPPPPIVKKSTWSKKVIPLVLSTMVGAGIMYAIQPLLLPASTIVGRGGQVAIIHSSSKLPILGRIRFLWSKVCQLTSKTILTMIQQSQHKFHSIIV